MQIELFTGGIVLNTCICKRSGVENDITRF